MTILWGCRDSCKKMDCINGSYCHEGECLCSKWYSGNDCGLQYNRNYEGKYSGEYTYPGSENRPLKEVVPIAADAEIPNRMILASGIYFEFETDSTLLIPLQSVVDTGDTLVLSGSGKYGQDVIGFTYTVQPTAGIETSQPQVVAFTGVRVKEERK